ncbi:MAG: histidine kinase [Acidobacteria bacterium]|nr:histidine kinase [Acidobacteriota bacterium]
MLEGPLFLSADQSLLTTLIVKLAVMAVLATMLARFRRFRHILIFERRVWTDRLVFAVAFGVPLMAGVAARLLLNYQATDLTLEGAFLAGLIAGPYAGATVGALVGLPPLVAGEVIALPFAIGCGFAGGGLREVCPKEAIWRFTPFVFVDLRKHVWQIVRRLEPNWQLVLLAAPIALELLRQAFGFRFGVHRLFYLNSTSPWMTALVVLATVLAVATPIKIWNSARIEHRLQEQETLLLAAKIEALKSQINPHFLFNTLASISSLIRSEPDTARMLIIKLSGLLRRLIRSHQHFVTLREELEAIDEYLDIEVVRFGSKLGVRKEISPDTTELIVPSMILQPLVENSIKHGLARKIGPGSIVIRSWRDRDHGRAILEVEDDGMGFLIDRLDAPMSSGIGLANVRERLQVIYGATSQLTLTSEPGRGTRVRIEIPELAAIEAITA